MKIKVLSLPSRHPYMSKFHGGEIVFVNPNTNYFLKGRCIPEYIHKRHSPKSYHLVHFHFSFDRLSVKELEEILIYFKKIKKPVLWTCHSKENQRIKNYGNGQYQKLLFKYVDQIISPTYGCKKWIEDNLGKHKRKIAVIPLGYMASPKDVKKFKNKIKKDKNLFTYLIGDFRENKEVIQAIINFLQCSDLTSAKLQLIFKPINIYSKQYGEGLDLEKQAFLNFLHNPRVSALSLPNIKNSLLIKSFLKSHAIILPYRWGTHSGQIELAKDCGCHAVASNVGFYREQWANTCLWEATDGNYREYPTRYTEALLDAYERKSIKPMGNEREKEFNDILNEHLKIYHALVKKSGE